jgi:hypothetical protein
MATTTFTVTHNRSSDYKGEDYDSPRLACQKIATFFQGLGSGVLRGFSVTASQDAATGTVTLSGVDGVAATGSYALSGVGGASASGTVTLAGGAGNVTVTINGESIGPVPFNTDDDTTASDVAIAINAQGDFGGLLFGAVSFGPEITILAVANGDAGNVPLAASRSAGSATPSGPTLTGGMDGEVTVVINGTSVGPVDVTNLTDTQAATAVAAAIEANGTLGPLLAAVGSTANVNLTWGTKGTVGNAVTLAAGVSTTGTATRSGATLSGGADNDVTVTVGGVAVVTDTTALSTSAAATAVAAAITADAGASALVTAEASSNVVTLTSVEAGTGGNGISLVAATSGGTATASAATLSGGTESTYTL